jgi:large subunit ribosomal protein L17
MHNKIKGRKLGRTTSHRKALLRNLANQLFEHKEIRTTTAKAKEARSHVERLITYAKKGDVHHRRLAFAFLRNKNIIDVLFDEIAPVYTDRPGGYTRVVKLGRRSGDAAQISLLQLVDFEKVGETPKKKTEKKKSKSSESNTTKQKEDSKQEQPVAAAEPVEDTIQEAEVIDEKIEEKEQLEKEPEEKTESVDSDSEKEKEETVEEPEKTEDDKKEENK